MAISRSFFVLQRGIFVKLHKIHNFTAIANFSSQTTSTVDQKEVDKFNKSAGSWWDKKFSLLHTMNTLRVPLIRDGLLETSHKINKKTFNPLKDFSILDVGCGGGILCEPLARLGASVTGLDPGIENISIATEHAAKDKSIKDRVHYVCDTIENFSQQQQKFDAVVCSEVIEHVDNVPLFIEHCVELVNDGGSLFFTTPNKTNLSYLTAIILAEYVFGIIPRNTHDWNKFIPSENLIEMLESNNCTVILCQGMLLNPLTSKWSWSKYNDIIYAVHAVKESSAL